MHHDIVRLLDQYNLVQSPHGGQAHMGAGGAHSALGCGSGVGFVGMRAGPQGKKSRRGGAKAAGGGAGGGAKELKDVKAKRRKKPAGGEMPSAGPAGGGAGGVAGNAKAASGGLSESSVTLSPIDSLESPHSFAGDAAGGGIATTTASPPLLPSPSARPLLPPVSHMLGQQPAWAGLAKQGYGLLPHTLGTPHPASAMLGPMNVTMSREQLPPIVTFQMMAPGSGQAVLKQSQLSQLQPHSQALPPHLQCAPGMMYQMPDVGLTRPLSHSLPHPHSHSIAHSNGLGEPQPRQLPPYHTMQSPVDKYPTPPSQHSCATASSEGTTPGHPAHPPNEHPYLTPSPESPDPWSSSSPHSNSDWSDVTTSPTPLGNLHALPLSRHTHIPEQAPPQPQAQQMQAQQPQHSGMQVYA